MYTIERFYKDFTNNVYNLRHSNIKSIMFNLNKQEIEQFYLSHEIPIEIKNYVIPIIMDNTSEYIHIPDIIFKHYILLKHDVNIKNIQDVDKFFYKELKEKSENDFDVTEYGNCLIIKKFKKIQNSFFKNISLKNIRNLHKVNLNEFLLEKESVFDFMLFLFSLKNEENKKIEISYLFSHIIDLFIRFSDSKHGYNERSEEAKNNIIKSLKSFFKSENEKKYLKYLNIETLFFNKVKKSNAERFQKTFSELERLSQFTKHNPTFIQEMYEIKKQLHSENNIIIVNLFCSASLNDYAYEEFFKKDIKNGYFNKDTTTFYLSDHNDSIDKFGLVLVENNYIIDSLSRRLFNNIQYSKFDFLKKILDLNLVLNISLEEILEPLDMNFIFLSEQDSLFKRKKIEAFIIDHKDIVFNKDLRITENGIELIELNFKN